MFIIFIKFREHVKDMSYYIDIWRILLKLGMANKAYNEHLRQIIGAKRIERYGGIALSTPHEVEPSYVKGTVSKILANRELSQMVEKFNITIMETSRGMGPEQANFRVFNSLRGLEIILDNFDLK